MSINIADFFQAGANVDASGGVPSFSSQRGFNAAITDNGVGDYTVELTDGVDASQRVTILTPLSGAVAVHMTAQDVDDTHIRIRAFTDAGAAVDVDFNVAVLKFI